MVKIKIAIGSKNPVKIKACHNVAEKIWGEVEVLSFAVPSGVAEQPLTEKETIQGVLIGQRERASKVMLIMALALKDLRWKLTVGCF